MHCPACDLLLGEREEPEFDGLCTECAYVVKQLLLNMGDLIEIPSGLYEDWEQDEMEDEDDDGIPE